MADAAILIAGAGPVGLTTALALHQAGHAVRVIDARPAPGTTAAPGTAHSSAPGPGTAGSSATGPAGTDPRAVALSHGSRLILQRLGVWQDISATPIAHIHVSQQGGFGQTRIEAADHAAEGIDTLGFVTRLGALTQTLRNAAHGAGIRIDDGHALKHSTRSAVEVIAHVAAAGTMHEIATPLLLLAEGKPAADAARKDYGQSAVVTEAWAESLPAGASAAAHEERAYERFTPEGPLALLPLESGYSVVWCMRDARARDMLAQDDAAFLAALTRATAFAGHRWTRVAARSAFSLALVQGAPATHPRELALGNAAQTLHPVAGQGLNLGLRDAFELAEALKGGLHDAALTRCARQRERDRAATRRLTDQYVSLFSNEFVPLRAARGAGLALLNLVPPLRRAVARRMMFGLR